MTHFLRDQFALSKPSVVPYGSRSPFLLRLKVLDGDNWRTTALPGVEKTGVVATPQDQVVGLGDND